MRPVFEAGVELQLQSGVALVVPHQRSCLYLNRSGALVQWDAGYLEPIPDLPDSGSRLCTIVSGDTACFAVSQQQSGPASAWKLHKQQQHQQQSTVHCPVTTRTASASRWRVTPSGGARQVPSGTSSTHAAAVPQGGGAPPPAAAAAVAAATTGVGQTTHAVAWRWEHVGQLPLSGVLQRAAGSTTAALLLSSARSLQGLAPHERQDSSVHGAAMLTALAQHLQRGAYGSGSLGSTMQHLPGQAVADALAWCATADLAFASTTTPSSSSGIGSCSGGAPAAAPVQCHTSLVEGPLLDALRGLATPAGAAGGLTAAGAGTGPHAPPHRMCVDAVQPCPALYVLGSADGGVWLLPGEVAYPELQQVCSAGAASGSGGGQAAAMQGAAAAAAAEADRSRSRWLLDIGQPVVALLPWWLGATAAAQPGLVPAQGRTQPPPAAAAAAAANGEVTEPNAVLVVGAHGLVSAVALRSSSSAGSASTPISGDSNMQLTSVTWQLPLGVRQAALLAPGTLLLLSDSGQLFTASLQRAGDAAALAADGGAVRSSGYLGMSWPQDVAHMLGGGAPASGQQSTHGVGMFGKNDGGPAPSEGWDWQLQQWQLPEPATAFWLPPYSSSSSSGGVVGPAPTASPTRVPAAMGPCVHVQLGSGVLLQLKLLTGHDPRQQHQQQQSPTASMPTTSNRPQQQLLHAYVSALEEVAAARQLLEGALQQQQQQLRRAQQEGLAIAAYAEADAAADGKHLAAAAPCSTVPGHQPGMEVAASIQCQLAVQHLYQAPAAAGSAGHTAWHLAVQTTLQLSGPRFELRPGWQLLLCYLPESCGAPTWQASAVVPQLQPGCSWQYNALVPVPASEAPLTLTVPPGVAGRTAAAGAATAMRTAGSAAAGPQHAVQSAGWGLSLLQGGWLQVLLVGPSHQSSTHVVDSHQRLPCASVGPTILLQQQYISSLQLMQLQAGWGLPSTIDVASGTSNRTLVPPHLAAAASGAEINTQQQLAFNCVMHCDMSDAQTAPGGLGHSAAQPPDKRQKVLGRWPHLEAGAADGRELHTIGQPAATTGGASPKVDLPAWLDSIYGSHLAGAAAARGGDHHQQHQQQQQSPGTCRVDLGPLGRASVACLALSGNSQLPTAAASSSSSMSTVCQVRLAASSVQGLALLHRPWALQVLRSLQRRQPLINTDAGELGLLGASAQTPASLVRAGSTVRGLLQLAGRQLSSSSSRRRAGDPGSAAPPRSCPDGVVLLSDVPRLQRLWLQMYQLQQQSARLRQLLQAVVRLRERVEGAQAGVATGGSMPTAAGQDDSMAQLLAEVDKVQQGLVALYGSYLLASSTGVIVKGG